MLSLAGELLPDGSWPGDPSTHPDLWLEDSPDERISIRRVRAGGDPGSLQEFLSLRTYAGGARVAIIARADRLTEEAANSLLKTVEEPPPRTHLLLTAHSPERLPATIVSRCARLALGLVESPAIEAWLRDRQGVDPATAELAAELGAGRPGGRFASPRTPKPCEPSSRSSTASSPSAGAGLRRRLAGRRRAHTRERQRGPGASPPRPLHLGIVCPRRRGPRRRAPELARLRSRSREAEAWAGALSPGQAGRILDALLRAGGQVAAYAQPRLLLEALFLDTFAAIPAPPAVA